MLTCTAKYGLTQISVRDKRTDAEQAVERKLNFAGCVFKCLMVRTRKVG